MIGEYCRVTPEKLSQLLAGDPQDIDDFLSDSWDSAEEEILRIDKTWQAIHFLLNDDPHTGEGPLYDAVWGGTDTAAEYTYGPVRYLTARQNWGESRPCRVCCSSCFRRRPRRLR